MARLNPRPFGATEIVILLLPRGLAMHACLFRSAALLLTLLIMIVGTTVRVRAQQVEPQAAYFVFDVPPNTDTFVIKLTDRERIQEARDIVAAGARKIVQGTIIKQPVYYNSPWSYYLDPKSIAFADFAIELCDASPRYLEQNLSTAYPNWCPWNSRLLREIPPPAKPGTENLVPNISMTFPHADNTYTDVSLATIPLVANADDADGTITKVEFRSNGNVIGETTTYPYSFTWRNLTAGSYTVSATATDDKGASTTSRSVTFVINRGPPQLLTDANSKTLAFESVTLTTEPFAVLSEHFLSSDRRTRLLLFGVNLELLADETIAAISAQAEDSQARIFVLPVEAVTSVPNFPWLTQVTVKLPDELQGIGDVSVSVSLRGVRSNKVTIKIR